MTQLPKGNKGLRAKLRRETQIANLELKRALLEASKALDSQTQELTAMRRILISERAQVIYYTDKYVAFVKHECVDVIAQGFLELDESVQEPYIKRAIEELSSSQGIVPHDRDAQQVQQQSATVAKKIILQ